MKPPDKSALVQYACDEVEAGILSAYAAGIKYGVARSSITRAIKRRANVCPTCGQQCLAHQLERAEYLVDR
jgi:hypothetical protein